MDDTSPTAWQHLLETGTLVPFQVVDAHTEAAPDGENMVHRTLPGNAAFIFRKK